MPGLPPHDPLVARLRGWLAGRLRHRWIEPAISSALRAALVREPVRFALRELGGRQTVGTYGLRGSSAVAVLEHNSPDVLVLDEVFYQRIYEPPAPVTEALAVVERPRIVDVGANIGLFAAWAAARWPGSRIEAFEPDPRNVELQRRAVTANRAEERWAVHPVAAAARAGRLRFLLGRYALSGPAGPDDAGATDVEAVDVLPALLDADLIKLDAEGSEWAILDDPRFSRTTARAIALEYHPEHCPEPDARTAAVGRLERIGFEVLDVPTQAPPGYGSLWAWR